MRLQLQVVRHVQPQVLTSRECACVLACVIRVSLSHVALAVKRHVPAECPPPIGFQAGFMPAVQAHFDFAHVHPVAVDRGDA